MKHLRQIVVSLGRANPQEFQNARHFFAPLPQDKAIAWNNGPRMQRIYALLRKNGIEIGIAGKAVLEDPPGALQIPNRSRVTSAVPEIFDRIKGAVAEDAK